MNNKSGRMGEGNKPAREEVGIHKQDLLRIAAILFQIQTTNAPLAGTRLFHQKTDVMKTIYDAHEKHPHLVPFKLPQRSKWQPLPVDSGLMDTIRAIATMNAGQVGERFGGEGNKDLQTISDPKEILRNNLGFFAGQDTDGNFYFQTALRQRNASLIKVDRTTMPGNIFSELSQPIAATSTEPAPVILQLGKTPTREFINSIRQTVSPEGKSRSLKDLYSFRKK